MDQNLKELAEAGLARRAPFAQEISKIIMDGVALSATQGRNYFAIRSDNSAFWGVRWRMWRADLNFLQAYEEAGPLLPTYLASTAQVLTAYDLYNADSIVDIEYRLRWRN
jgi:hypothetical protein